VARFCQYLKLSDQEKAVFEEELARIEPRQEEQVMRIVTSWMEEGIEQGLQQGRQQEAVLMI
jgi:hypothetical protein